MKRFIILGGCIMALGIIPMAAQSQSADSAMRRNTIKMDITSHWLYRNAIMLSYERTLKSKPFQSWSVTAGVQQFPPLDGVGSINVLREKNASGYKLGGEYRFYLPKENKHKAPRGVYVGPYTNLHVYNNNRSVEVDNNGVKEFAELETDLSIFNIGVQLGYQFIINNRWAIDLVFIGPSVANYRFKTELTGNYTFDPDDITNEIILGLIDKFPGFSELITEKEFASNGKVNTWSYGYRYQFQVGYVFGKKNSHRP